MWKYITTLGGDFCGEEISEDILPLAQAAGLCCRVKYDPFLHGEGIKADPGCEIWYWGNAEMRDGERKITARSTVDSAKVREWMHALPWSPQWDWLREEMAAAIGEPPPDVPEMPNPMANLLGILRDGENFQGHPSPLVRVVVQCPCSACGGCGMLPGTGLNDDVMNRPCPDCNEWARHDQAWQKSFITIAALTVTTTHTKLKNGWNEGEATEDGVYLRAFDEWDDDEDGDEFQLIGGKWHKDGAPWVCYGGVWKRTGDLPNDEMRDAKGETKS